MAARYSILERDRCGRIQDRLVQALARENLLGLMRPPRHRRDAAKCDTSLPDPVAVEIEPNRG